MKRILLISRCPPYPLHLGDRLIIWHLTRELTQRGYEIDLLAFANREEDWQEPEQYAKYFGQVQLFHEPERTVLSYLQRLLLPGSRFPRRAEHSWSPEMWQAIENASRTKYDAIHFFGGVQVYEFHHAIGTQSAIITPYESYSLYLKRLVEQEGGINNRLNRLIARQFERWMFAPYACTVVVAPPDKEELQQINPALQVEVISNGIDLEYFAPQAAERDHATLLFTGNYEYAPNVDAALRLAREIMPQIRQQIPDARLQIVGNAPPPELQALGNEYIEITGCVPDVRPYLAQATAFVCPLRLGAGIKNKVLEALAMGLPTIATPLSIDGISVEHEKHVLIASVDEMVETVVRLLKNRALQQSLAASGIKLIEERYNWSQVATRYEELYQSLK